MPFQDLTPPPPAPQRTDDADAFVAKADAHVAWLSTFTGEMMTLVSQIAVAASIIGLADAYADEGLMEMVGNTTPYGRSLVNLPNAAEGRVALGLAPFFQSGSEARIATNGTLAVRIDDAQNVHLAAGLVTGSGRLRVFTSGSIYGVTTYGTVNYNAMQFVREEGGVGVERGTITVSDTGTSYNTVSDASMKEDKGLVTPVQAWAILRLVQMHNYDWKGSGKTDIGPFAQELFEVYPDSVSKGGWFNEDGEEVTVAHVGATYRPWGVDHAKLVPLLTVAIQDIDQRLIAAGI